LVEDLVRRAGRHGSSFITLEVRAGNRGAISLYTSLLFQPVAVRKGYYSGREDAIIMLREFGKRPPAAS
jgi:ribosomal-protein-alanine N-acetyltransferase